jgi:hypothetical protein
MKAFVRVFIYPDLPVPLDHAYFFYSIYVSNDFLIILIFDMRSRNYRATRGPRSSREQRTLKT